MNRIAAAVVSLIAGSPISLYTGPPPDRDPAEACGALADLRIEDTNLLSAAVVPASGDLPEYCRVLGYVRPAIHFEIRLPTSDWNGKFYMAGCGAFCGELSSDSDYLLDITPALQRQYAVSMTDGGHWGESSFDARWAHNNRVAETDFGHRAVHETARVTKEIIQAFYGRMPAYSYFGGCSTGGRLANMAALRYPEDFDGIISGAPDLALSRWAGLYAPWLGRSNTGPDGKNLIMRPQATLVEQAVYKACDPLDGLEDGLIGDPRACSFDPAVLVCGGGRDADCLSSEQISALRAFYGGPKNSEGDPLYEGVPFGSESYWPMWISGWFTRETAEVSDDLLPAVGLEFLRYMAFQEDPGDAYTLMDLDLDRDPPRLAFMARIYDSDSPDLEAFRAHGGKMMMWHGWADAAVPPLGSIQYYEAVEKHVGSRAATQEFLRLFMLPGMDHCGLGDGPGIQHTGFDPFQALERWVEEGEMPLSLLMTKTDSAGDVLWTRPSCPYPQRAVFNGEGDASDASNFSCTTPH